MGEQEEDVSEAVNLFKPVTAPGPLSRDELEGGDEMELWVVRVPPQVSSRDSCGIILCNMMVHMVWCMNCNVFFLHGWNV